MEGRLALREGWLHTGDVGYVDDEGLLHLVDRMQDPIDAGGAKVYPRDVEEVAIRHPEVSQHGRKDPEARDARARLPAPL